MTDYTPIIKAERIKGGVQLEVKGDAIELISIYREITAAMFACFIDSAKGDSKEEMAQNGVDAMTHTLLCGVGLAFDRNYNIDMELKPLVKKQLQKTFPKFDFDADVYFMDEDDNETMKKAANRMLDDLQDRADKAAKRGDIRAMLEVLERLADMTEAIKKAKEENTK